jgi:signal transduction histidine kinase
MRGVGDKVVGWVTVLREVTERKELEQFREDLTSMVIHNLQGPLAALISSLETLKGEASPGSDMTEQLVNIALGSSQRLYGRIESLLWIRRIEERRMPLALRQFPVSVVAQPVVEEYRALAEREGIQLETEFDPMLPDVLVDEELIGRVFSNLLDNALKYTPNGGFIKITAMLRGDQGGAWVLCSVEDSGSGVSDGVRKVLFEKFRTGEPSASSSRRGMGIGLHYCKAAVEAHGGSIWLESEKDHGSTFLFTLPISAKDAGAR